MKIMIINGPNLNMLEYRDSSIYGKKTLNEINQELKKNNKEHDLFFFQANSEGEIIDKIHQAIRENYPKLIINPGAYAHYSYAILDALAMFNGEKIEVHLSDVMKREKFRQNLITGQACDLIISGLGEKGYQKAIEME